MRGNRFAHSSEGRKKTDRHTWGYRGHDHDWKSTQTLIRNLVDIASKGGNYLPNIGPMADGSVPPESIDRMHGIGQWMRINGESIDGTQASPVKEPAWVKATFMVLSTSRGSRGFSHKRCEILRRPWVRYLVVRQGAK